MGISIVKCRKQAPVTSVVGSNFTKFRFRALGYINTQWVWSEVCLLNHLGVLGPEVAVITSISCLFIEEFIYAFLYFVQKDRDEDLMFEDLFIIDNCSPVWNNTGNTMW